MLTAVPLLKHSKKMLDRLSFSEAIKRASEAESAQGGIGTYGEKMLHRTLKFFFEPDDSKHEVAFLGAVADIKNDDGVIEIQTRSFDKLLSKLELFLPEERVTVVCPIIEKKRIFRIDSESGNICPPSKSSKIGRPSHALAELSMIRRFVPNENLTVIVVLLDADETRLLSGKLRVGRKRTSKINCIPTSLSSVIELRSGDDYRRLLPTDMPSSFSSAEFEKLSGLSGRKAHAALMLLLQLGILTRERRGSAGFTYTLTDNK